MLTSDLKIDDIKAVFRLVFKSLPDKVKVYPTENYYYFYFYHDGVKYAGNFRFDVEDLESPSYAADMPGDSTPAVGI